MGKAETKFKVNLLTLINEFGHDDVCREYLSELRWPDGVACPRCGTKSVSEISTRDQLDCNKCRCRFSVTAGTIFHRSKMPLSKWFLVAYMMVEAKKGVSANQIKRTIGVTYKTAWFMCHRIRSAMSAASEAMAKLDGVIEIDDTYVGGEVRGMGAGYVGNKARVVGIIERDGDVQLKRVNRADRKTILDLINRHIASDAEAVYTDEAPTFRSLSDQLPNHQMVEHRKEEWARGPVNTNSIENVWSLFKRSVAGSYHVVSPKHLDAYLDELEWRFNNRQNPWLFRETMRQLVKSVPLEYKELTAG